MQKMRAALGGLLLFIWIMAAVGCTGQKTEQTVNSEETQYCWATVTLEGGSGKASVESPCPVLERSGELLAVITWSSSHYDFMVIDGEKILPVNTEGNSKFEVPLKSVARSSDTSQTASLPEDCEMQVQADTTAMSTRCPSAFSRRRRRLKVPMKLVKKRTVQARHSKRKTVPMRLRKKLQQLLTSKKPPNSQACSISRKMRMNTLSASRFTAMRMDMQSLQWMTAGAI